MTEGPHTNGSDRDARGRFADGNPGGPGNPAARRAAKLRHAAQDVIGPEHIGAMMRKAMRMALEGDLAAMRFVMDRVVGRAGEEVREPEPLDIALPPMATAADCNLALQRIIDAIWKGAIDQDTAKLLMVAIQTRFKAIEVNELEERLAKLEATANTVDHGASARGRRPWGA